MLSKELTRTVSRPGVSYSVRPHGLGCGRLLNVRLRCTADTSKAHKSRRPIPDSAINDRATPSDQATAASLRQDISANSGSSAAQPPCPAMQDTPNSNIGPKQLAGHNCSPMDLQAISTTSVASGCQNQGDSNEQVQQNTKDFEFEAPAVGPATTPRFPSHTSSEFDWAADVSSSPRNDVSHSTSDVQSGLVQSHCSAGTSRLRRSTNYSSPDLDLDSLTTNQPHRPLRPTDSSASIANSTNYSSPDLDLGLEQDSLHIPPDRLDSSASIANSTNYSSPDLDLGLEQDSLHIQPHRLDSSASIANSTNYSSPDLDLGLEQDSLHIQPYRLDSSACIANSTNYSSPDLDLESEPLPTSHSHKSPRHLHSSASIASSTNYSSPDLDLGSEPLPTSHSHKPPHRLDSAASIATSTNYSSPDLDLGLDLEPLPTSHSHKPPRRLDSSASIATSTNYSSPDLDLESGPVSHSQHATQRVPSSGSLSTPHTTPQRFTHAVRLPQPTTESTPDLDLEQAAGTSMETAAGSAVGGLPQDCAPIMLRPVEREPSGRSVLAEDAPLRNTSSAVDSETLGEDVMAMRERAMAGDAEGLQRKTSQPTPDFEIGSGTVPPALAGAGPDRAAGMPGGFGVASDGGASDDRSAAGDGEGLRPRLHVTSAFVIRDDGKVLLVKRSDQVGTYHFKWGAVSGGVESNDRDIVDRALAEIDEEVGIPCSALTLVRSGRPLMVDDGQRKFAVHPFLFQLGRQDVEIKLNWENVGYCWVEPHGIHVMDTVPQLQDTVDRVLLSTSQQTWMEKFAADRDHGASQMALWVLDALDDWLAERQLSASGESLGLPEVEALRDYVYHLACVRPSMCPVAHVAVQVAVQLDAMLRSIADPFERTAGEVWHALRRVLDGMRQQLPEMRAAAVDVAQSVLHSGQTVMTLSYSSTVLQVFQQAVASGKQLKAIVCESRPLCEGVRLARDLSRIGVDVELITDAQAGVMMSRADLVLVGADAVLPQGVVNKVGTAVLALAAGHHAIPMYAVCTSIAVSAGPVEHILSPIGSSLEGGGGHEEMASEEVTAMWAGQEGTAGLRVRNIYFEETPLPLLTGVITEDGIMESVSVNGAVELYRQHVLQAMDMRS